MFRRGSAPVVEGNDRALLCFNEGGFNEWVRGQDRTFDICQRSEKLRSGRMESSGHKMGERVVPAAAIRWSQWHRRFEIGQSREEAAIEGGALAGLLERDGRSSITEPAFNPGLSGHDAALRAKYRQ